MTKKLEFRKIQKEDIFCESFRKFDKNNTIELSSAGIAVLYGPNGVGKTSLATVLNCEKDCEYEVIIEGKTIKQSNRGYFHIINDQNGRNIISGSAEEFLLGDDIKKEYDLQKYIESEFLNLLANKLSGQLKNDFGISKKSTKLIDIIEDANIKAFVSDIANVQSKGKLIDRDFFLTTISNISHKEIPDFDEKKLIYIKDDYDLANSIIRKILSIKIEGIAANRQIQQIEEHDVAIKILDKYGYKDECVVCDHEIDSEELLQLKKGTKETIYKSLDAKTKDILENIINSVSENDPFRITDAFVVAIRDGNQTIVIELVAEIRKYMTIFSNMINNMFAMCLQGSELRSRYAEYKIMLENKPEFTDEDIQFIERIVSENIEKEIKLVRDASNKNLKLVLEGQEFLNQERAKLKLSNGEQNFLSLSLEMLRAKNSKAEIIVIDDPISSFDSIYKNKIAFSIIKFLESKCIIVLTHNTDLIKLMEHQKQKCFNLYLINNADGEENGFIPVNYEEQEILLHIDKLLNLFRTKVLDEVEDEKSFLLSMIPFMRGYCQITDDKNNKDKLTQLMHGYNIEEVDVAAIFNSIFGANRKIDTKYEVSADEITLIDIETVKIFKSSTSYPLLGKTLLHTLTYLYLRLNVEKRLVAKFNINFNRYDMLSQIIMQAYKGSTQEEKQNRVFLASRKTLLNEFNHFEGNMNIFQPAIDITDAALRKEKEDIMLFLTSIA